ncbi:MAG: hypothetical protein M3255_10950 [Pseudomonadota bacterium]|nr:hypothetical protein [Pseudomonadota bacterium]
MTLPQWHDSRRTLAASTTGSDSKEYNRQPAWSLPSLHHVVTDPLHRKGTERRLLGEGRQI